MNRKQTYIVECQGYIGSKPVDKTVTVTCRDPKSISDLALMEAQDRCPKFRCNSFRVWSRAAARQEMRRLERMAKKLARILERV